MTRRDDTAFNDSKVTAEPAEAELLSSGAHQRATDCLQPSHGIPLKAALQQATSVLWIDCAIDRVKLSLDSTVILSTAFDSRHGQLLTDRRATLAQP